MAYIHLLNCILEAVSVYIFIFCRYRHKRAFWKDIVITTLFYSLYFGIYRFGNLNLYMFFAFMMYFFMILLFADVRINRALNEALICFLFAAISEVIAQSAMYALKSYISSRYTRTDEVTLNMIITRLCFFALVLAFVKTADHIEKKVPVFLDSGVVTISLTALALAFAAVQNTGIISVFHDEKIIWVYVVIGIILVFGVFSIILIGRVQREQRNVYVMREEMLRDQNEKSYSRLLSRFDHEQRLVIHDYKKHLGTVESLLEEKAYDEARLYLSDVIRAGNSVGEIIKTDNHTLSVLLSRYSILCKEQGIDFSADTVNARLYYMTSVDVTSLFGNLLDNAMDAAVKAVHPLVTIRIGHDLTRGIDVINISNTCSGSPHFDKKGFLRTTKKDRKQHGFGMESIKRVVDRYNGTVTIRYMENDSIFQVAISLYSEDDRQ